MAPEILVKSVRLKSASFDDLKKVDMWAFGMVLFCLVNPDLKYPYQLDINHDENPIEQVEDLLTNHKRPTPSTKYSEMQTANWLIIHEAYEACTNFEPSQRLSAEQIKHKLCAVQPINQNQASNIQRKESDELKKLRYVV
jgi:serine/threonine protein kinase